MLNNVWHALKIKWTLIKYGIDDLVLEQFPNAPFQSLKYLRPWKLIPRTHKLDRGERIRLALEDLGPIFVKFGQALSTRRDLLPDDIAESLAKLQDKVKPFPSDQAIQVIEQSLGESVRNAFAKFEAEPMASASIAQVHAAQLHSGEDVVVKVVRPGIEKIIAKDLRLLKQMARQVETWIPSLQRLHPIDVVNEFEKTLLDELDMQREASNAGELARNFKGSDLLYVPKVHWDFVREKVMVMERIYGTPIGQIDVLKDKGVDFEKLSREGVEIFFTQVFRDNFFHADMHPGNIFVGDNGQYKAIDFGIMGMLSTEDQRYLALNFLAFFNRDYRKVAELHIESAWVNPNTRVEEFESAIRAISEPIFGRPLKDISFGLFLLNLFKVARRFEMEVQPQLVLLQKTLLNIEGLGRQLNPELDLWATAKPFLENWLKERTSAKTALNKIKGELPVWIEALPTLPTQVIDVVQQAQRGELIVQWQSKELTELKTQHTRYQRRMTWIALLGFAGIIATLIWKL